MKKIIAIFLVIFSLPIVYALEKNQSEIEGEIIAISKLPNPKKSDYPNCYYTAKIKVVNILKGTSVPKYLVAIILGFENYKLSKYAHLKKGQKVYATVIPFEFLSRKEKTIQQADDLGLFELDDYFFLKLRVIHKYQVRYYQPVFKGNLGYQSAFEYSINPPISQELLAMRKTRIAKKLSYLNKRFALVHGQEDVINKEFQKAWEQNQKKYDDFKNIYKWGAIDEGFFVLPKKYTLIKKNKKWLKNINSFKAFNEFLLKNGVQLIIQIVPDLYDISARVLNPNFMNYPDMRSLCLARFLLENNIEVSYISDALIKRAPKYPFLFFYYSNNFHWGYGAIDVATDIIAKDLADFKFMADLSDNDLIIKERNTVCGKKYKYPVTYGSHNKKDTIKTRTVLTKSGKHLSFYENSKILIIGNSFLNFPEQVVYPSLLAKKIKYKPQVIYRGGYGLVALIPRLLLLNKSLLKNKQVCIMPIPIGYTGYKFLNLKKLDKQLSMLSNKKLRYEFTCKNLIVKQKYEQQFVKLEKIKKECKNIIKTDFIIPSKEKFVLNILNIPDNVKLDKETIIVIEFILSYPRNITIKINNKNIKPDIYFINWQKIYAKVNAHKIKISILNDNLHRNVNCLIKGISIYQ